MPILDFSYALLLLIISIIGIIKYQRLSTPFKLLTISVIIELLLAIPDYVFTHVYKNNAPIIYLETICGFVFYALIYYNLFKNENLKRITIFIIVAVIVFFFINGLLLQPFQKEFPTNLFLVIHPLYAIFSLILFRQFLLYPVKINIFKQSVFWYNTAILFYATTLFVTLGLGNYVAKHHLKDYIILYYWYFILYVFAILIGYSIIRDSKQIE